MAESGGNAVMSGRPEQNGAQYTDNKKKIKSTGGNNSKEETAKAGGSKCVKREGGRTGIFGFIGGFFSGRARFYVQEADFRILNRFRRFKLSDIVIDTGCNSLEFTVPLRNSAEVERLTKCKPQYNRNFFRLLNVFYSRAAISVTAVICIIAFIVLNNFVFRVQVLGVEGEQKREIAEFIQIKPISLKSADKARETAAGIAANFEYVAHASSKFVGNTLYFRVYCVSLPDGKNDNGDVVAKEDGVITNVIVASGRALVKAGDVVRKGQVLIKGEYQVGESTDGETLFAPVRAVGEIMADVSYSEYGMNCTEEELLARITARTGIIQFDKVETFTPVKDVLEVVATVNKSIAL